MNERTKAHNPQATIVAARALLGDAESVTDAKSLRCLGYAAVFASAVGREVDILRGMHEAAVEAGQMELAAALEACIETVEG